MSCDRVARASLETTVVQKLLDASDLGHLLARIFDFISWNSASTIVPASSIAFAS